MSKLALLGGKPLGSQILQERLSAWPPKNNVTAQKLNEVYFSNQWAFSSTYMKDFEQAFADYHGVKHAIFMVNGTVTLQAALIACGVGPGDEVIVPALTWIATATAVHYIGAIPVFVDVDSETLCLDTNKISQAITEKTKAIIPVHLHGSMVDMDRLVDIGKQHDLKIIEDCAQVHGGLWDGKPIGSIGDISSFSFQLSKLMSSGEGGICLSNDDDLAERMYRVSHIGYTPDAVQGRPLSSPPEGLTCHNFRPTSFNAVILSDQLKGLDALTQKYVGARKYLEARLVESTHIRFQKSGRKATIQPVYKWVMIFDAPEYRDISIDTICAALVAEGLPVVLAVPPVYKHMLFNLEENKYRISHEGCHIAEQLVDRSLVLMHQVLGGDQKELEMIAEIIEKVMNNCDPLRSYQDSLKKEAFV